MGESDFNAGSNLINCYSTDSGSTAPLVCEYIQNVVNCLTDHLIRNHGVIYFNKAAKEINFYHEQADFHDKSLFTIKIVVD